MTPVQTRYNDLLADASPCSRGSRSPDLVGRVAGGVWGPFFGVLSFAFLFVVMTSFGISDAGKLIAQGFIILLAAIFYGLKARTN